MKEIILTCPFTGLEFKALEDSNGNAIAKNVFTGEDVVMVDTIYDSAYAIDKEQFAHVETVTQAQAADVIGVSRMRVSKLCQTGQLVSVTHNGKVLITLDSVEAYRDSERKRGRKW